MFCSYCSTKLHETRGSHIVVNTVSSRRSFCEVLCWEAFEISQVLQSVRNA